MSDHDWSDVEREVEAWRTRHEMHERANTLSLARAAFGHLRERPGAEKIRDLVTEIRPNLAEAWERHYQRERGDDPSA